MKSRVVTCNTNSYVHITLYYILLKYNLLRHPKQVSYRLWNEDDVRNPSLNLFFAKRCYKCVLCMYSIFHLWLFLIIYTMRRIVPILTNCLGRDNQSMIGRQVPNRLTSKSSMSSPFATSTPSTFSEYDSVSLITKR